MHTNIHTVHTYIHTYIHRLSCICAGVESYHIDRAERIFPDNSIQHRTIDGEVVVARNFLKKGPVTIGVTSGASTPDKYARTIVHMKSLNVL